MSQQPTSQFSTIELLKLVFILGTVFGVANETQTILVPLLFAAAVCGVFLAEHFATTRTREFSFLLLPPSLTLGCYVFVQVVDHSPTLSQFGIALIAGGIASILGILPASALIVIVTSSARVIYLLTGMTLLKHDWSE